MPRNLLPRLRSAPNPANVAQAEIGGWSTVTVPGDLAKLDYGNPDGPAARTRLQSVPSPWARMLLFRNALEDPTHPAYALVENEILDGLEFIWSAPTIAGARIRTANIRIDELRSQSQAVGAKRVEDLGDALVELRPTRDGRSAAFSTITLITVNDRPVIASSPYTLLFTAEDAGGEGVSDFFRFRITGTSRPLSARQRGFQQYIARVVLPQLQLAAPAESVDFSWVELRRIAAAWLQKQVSTCPGAAVDGNGLADGVDWAAQASSLGLSRFALRVAGVQLYQRSSDVGQLRSRWRIRPSRNGSTRAPLLIDPTTFDGVYFDGAAPVAFPAHTEEVDRLVLPETNVRHPWVDPVSDWFTPRLLMLDEPVDRSSVLGFAQYTSHGNESSDARIALPLTDAFFTLFRPADLDEMLRIQVDGDRVECVLRVPIGDDSYAREIEIRRVYDHSQTAQAAGPSLTLWPRFRDKGWNTYVLFRRDMSAQAAGLYTLDALDAEGRDLAKDQQRRASSVETLGFDGAPEVIVFRDKRTGAALGVLAPRFSTPKSRTGSALEVGIDFGTSNTVVSLRPEGAVAPHLMELHQMLLPLTQSSSETERFLEAYFFPRQLAATPFGTAVVHLKQLENFRLQDHGLGVRVNVPFEGNVEADDRNAVAGDLKWSSDNKSSFLTESFLRHVLAMVVTYAIEEGFDLGHVSVRYAYPRAFTEQQRAQLRDLWQLVWSLFAENGVRLGELREPIDESVAILQHFYNAGVASVAGRPTIVLDIGGGTADIAVYEHGQALTLDSLMIGGRNLTGSRLRAGTPDELRNPFVKAFAAWAAENNLSRFERVQHALAMYLRDGQDHLAFSYLAGSKWYQENASKISGSHVAQQFQAAVLYFFGGLFYYLGLTVREIGSRSGSDAMPRQIILAGNGSRYVSWLTGGGLPKDSVFQAFFGEMVRAGARAESGDRPTFTMSARPKEEVATGLVAHSDVPLDYATASHTTLVGERVQVKGSEGFLSAESRFQDRTSLETGDITKLQWDSDDMEIERYHNALLSNARSLTAADAHWNQTVNNLRMFFEALPPSGLQDLSRERMFYLAGISGGFRGSIFVLELTAVLDRMMAALFTAPHP